MNLLDDQSQVMEKTRELCQAITQNDQFQSLLKQVNAFLDDESARLAFQSVQERGQELNEKQRAGLELSDQEVRDFESARSEVFENPLSRNFLDAQQTLESLQQTVHQYLSHTLQTGEIPSPEDLAPKDGCCGGGCGCN